MKKENAMKAIAKRTINPETVEKIKTGLKSNIKTLCKEEGTIYDENRPAHCDDFLSHIEVQETKKDVTVNMTTSGGHEHTLYMSKNGQCVVEHRGARASFPGLGFDLLPKEFFEINYTENWRLVSVKSSRPEWATPIGLLNGQFGKGPANQREYDYIQEQKELKRINMAHKAIGREPVYYIDEKPKKYSALEYRRAGAMGVTL